ncbi:MAG: hypothetical protein A2X78_02225 [Gammaproteobacteria bacterium GWE2_37_16]|nr:MAG: hypothetical protein A2X78_02225 [Gammaproteobacteria bacterium GWE2_37_16]
MTTLSILAIGEEFLTGSLVDTNSSYIAEQGNFLGLEVIHIYCIGDDLERIKNVLLEMAEGADIVIVTGGLGPTPDDLTREAAAYAAKVDLQLSIEALAEIEAFFVNHNHPMPDSNRKQAMFPYNSQYLSNPIGTAPGFVLKIGKAECFFTPGVPREMKWMLHEQIIPLVEQRFSTQLKKLGIKELTTFGLSEAVIGEHLKEMEKKFPQVKFGTRANLPEIQVKLYVRGINNLAQKKLLDHAEAVLYSRIGNWVFTRNQQSMGNVVVDLLRQEQSSLAVAEIGNGGIIGDWLTNAELGSQYLDFCGIVNRNKVSFFIPNSSDLSNLELTKKMAEKIRVLFGSRYGIAINSIITEAEVSLLNEKIGTIYIAISENGLTYCFIFNLSFGDKEYQKRIFTMLALDLLRRKILKLEFLTEIFGKPLC